MEERTKLQQEVAEELENRSGQGERIRATEMLVNAVAESYAKHKGCARLDQDRLLNKEILIDVLEKLREILFPGYYEQERIRNEYLKYIIGEKLEYIQYHLKKQVAVVLGNTELCDGCTKSMINARAEDIVDQFLGKIPQIREILATDVQAFYDGDPAAYNTDEIILCYPGMLTVSTYRLAHELWLLKVPLIPRIWTEYAHSKTGIDIHPGATIGKYFFIDHGTGIVIGETTLIGENVKIYQGVTLGALSTRKGQKLKGKRRHPTIGDNVTIYANTTVLGGDTVIGSNVTIAGNTFIIDSVSSNMKVSSRAPELEYSSVHQTHTK